MGRRRSSERWRGASVCCRVAIVLLLCGCCLLVAMVATDAARLGPGAAGGLATSSPPVEWSGERAAGADAFRSSKRRIPKGPDPIHNRRAENTVAPRRRD